MATSDEYLAGLFDGEGCVSMHLAKAGYISIHVKVSMCDRAPVAALFARFGGSMSDGKQITKTGRQVYTWSLFNAECVEALYVFSKLCLVKSVVAVAALPTAESMASNPTRGVLSQMEKNVRVEAAQLIARINKPVGNRRILEAKLVDEYMAPKKMGGGKQVRLSNGCIYPTVSAAAQALKVSISAVSAAKRKGTKTAGVTVEAI
jgi:hypothetical protein